jgi:iron complex transport system substrate-binding protein
MRHAARALLAICLALCLALWGPAEGAETQPARVVSINLCTDQLAMLVAAPGQLRSVSFLAQDPAASVMWREAAAYDTNHALAEEVFLLAPDLVLASTYSPPVTLDMLRRLGIRVEQLPIAEGMAGIRANLLRVGALLGREAQAEAVAAGFDTALAEASADGAGPRPTAALLYSDSYSSGAGTLADAVLAAAGFDNLATELGFVGLRRLPLESLVLGAPDLLIADRIAGPPARAQEITGHPAARAMAGRRATDIDPALWICGLPQVTGAVAALAAERRAIAP